MRWKLLTLLPLLLMFVSLTIKAETDAEAPPKYQVEIVVFESLALKGWTEEVWDENPDMIETEDTMVPEPLEESSFMLNEEVSKMTLEKGYRILYHQSWILEGLPEAESTPVLIESLPEEDYNSRLDGTLKFYKSRFAHVRLNLELERKIPLRLREKFAEQQRIELESLPEFWRFQINEARKVKSKELHYFDHPIFGALFKIQYLKEEPKPL